MEYKVEMKYWHGWDDAGWTEETDAASKPIRFASVALAQREIAEFFGSVKAAVGAGDMDVEENPADYRIVAVGA